MKTQPEQAPSLGIIGICSDHNSTFLKGCASAPALIRKALYSGSANLTSESGIHLKKEPIVDYGDYHVEETEHSYLSIEEKVASLMTDGHSPLILGGDHAVTYPVMRAVAMQHPKLAILHFDAHPDLYDNFQGSRYSHACPFARIMEEKLADRLIQIGIRTLNTHQQSQADTFNVEMFQMKDFPWPEFPLHFNCPVYISFDMDALDPAFAPGVSHHEPGGLSVREVLGIIHSLDCNVVGADIVEYNPKRDINSMTAMVAAKLFKEIAAKILTP